MEKQQLAQDLRQRQYAAGMVDRRLIDLISDDQMIDSYLICSCCGKKQVTDQEKEEALLLATNSQQFFDFCDAFAGARNHQN